MPPPAKKKIERNFLRYFRALTQARRLNQSARNKSPPQALARMTDHTMHRNITYIRIPENSHPRETYSLPTHMLNIPMCELASSPSAFTEHTTPLKTPRLMQPNNMPRTRKGSTLLSRPNMRDLFRNRRISQKNKLQKKMEKPRKR